MGVRTFMRLTSQQGACHANAAGVAFEMRLPASRLSGQTLCNTLMTCIAII